MSSKPKTSSAPRPVLTPPKPEPRPGVQHQTQDHPQPKNTDGGFSDWGDPLERK